MTTTHVAPTTAERHAMSKPATAKPAGQPGAVPGHFAALMVQADEQASPPEARETSTTGSSTQEEDYAERSAAAATRADTTHLALQALLDWRSLAGTVPAETRSSTQATQVLSLPAHRAPAQQLYVARATAPMSATNMLPADAPSTQTRADAARIEPETAMGSTLKGESNDGLGPLPPNVSSDPDITGEKPRAGAFGVGATPAAGSHTLAADAGTTPKAAGKGNPTPANKSQPGNGLHTPTSSAVDVAPTSAAACLSKTTEPPAHIRSTVDLTHRNPEPGTSGEAHMSEITKTVDPMAVTARSGTEYPSGSGTQQAMTADPGGASVALGQDVAAAPDSFANLFQAHMDETGSQVSYWSAQGAQRANFTVGSAQDMPVEVTLSFVDGTLEVAFETEEQGVRELLENHAHEALQLLMEAQGIVLGGVSVGGGRPHAQRDTGAGNSTVDLSARGRGRKVEQLADPVASVARRTPETMTANKLDLYA